jgi:hypothetical protein
VISVSRTDKDVPYWVAADYYIPDHAGCEFVRQRWLWAGAERRECDLPESPVRKHRRLRYSWRTRNSARCAWLPDWDSTPGHGRAGWPPHGTPRWFVRARYHCPQRREARDVLRAAAADWRANGDTDLEPVPRQGRHSAHWDFW